jgi:peptide/nickel transport system permease protein
MTETASHQVTPLEPRDRLRGFARLESAWRFAREFAESRIAVVAFFVFVAILLAALMSPWIAPIDPYDISKIDILDNRLPPGSKSFSGMTYWLGTDGQGRDLLSAILYGLNTSLLVAVAAGGIALIVGVSAGLTAAHFGGRVDALIMRLVDLQLSFPTILVAFILLAILGRGIDKVILALAIVQWAYYCRTVRATALVEVNKEYVEAARGLGLGTARILFRHLLPNCLPPLLVVASVQVAHSIALEATLSFLGLGVPPTEPSLGLLIANGFQYLVSGRYWITFFPGLALLLMVISINLIGDRMRDVLNPHLQR